MTTENIVIVIIQASIGLLIVALTASINIKIKFATTENQAKNDAILIFSKILAAVGFFGASSTLLYELYLPEPLTKESLRSILILSFDIIFVVFCMGALDDKYDIRSEEHTSELQSRGHLVCRLLLEKKNIYISSSILH